LTVAFCQEQQCWAVFWGVGSGRPLVRGPAAARLAAARGRQRGKEGRIAAEAAGDMRAGQVFAGQGRVEPIGAQGKMTEWEPSGQVLHHGLG